MESVTRLASLSSTPRPTPGNTKALLHWPMTCLCPCKTTGLEGRAGGHQSAAIGMLQGFGGRAFGFAGGIAEREDDGPLAVVGHRADGRRGEVARLAGGADEDGGAHGPDELFQRVRRRTGQADSGQFLLAQGDLAFVVFQIGTAFPDQAARIHEDLALAHFGFRSGPRRATRCAAAGQCQPPRRPSRPSGSVVPARASRSGAGRTGCPPATTAEVPWMSSLKLGSRPA